jgi:metal-responsive CopG/Arc/MetJ family transcriptional regulator
MSATGKNSKARGIVAKRKESDQPVAGERVLVEFPAALLERADSAARAMDQDRSELIRAAVEQLLDRLERTRLELELAEGYAANAQRNLELVKEFAEVDKEGLS